MKKLKIVITGGHHNSALVVARALRDQGHLVYWFGHRHTSRSDSADSAEYLEVMAAKIPFYNLAAGKLGSPPKLLDILSFPFGFMQATILLFRLRPDCVLSFGGYLGFTTSLVGACFRLPLFLHEQTIVPGKTNLLVSRLAKRLYLTWESSLKYFSPQKTLITGLPLRPSFSSANQKQLFLRHLPTILVLGGKQGSHAINSLIFAHLPDLLHHYNLLHQTGTSSATGDYEQALALKDSLPLSLSPFYEPRSYIGEDEIATLLKNADLYLGRSGAHITYELAVLGKKAVLIPFLFTHGHEQHAHAQLLEKAGLAVILPQSELSFPRLKESLSQALSLPKPSPLDLPLHATKTIVADLTRLL